MPSQSTMDTFETPEARNDRFARGEITEEEIQAYLAKPDQPLFTYQLTKKRANRENDTLNCTVSALTIGNSDSVLEAVRESWEYNSDYDAMKNTFNAYFEKKDSGVPGLLNSEYYIVNNDNNEVIAVTGIYSVDIQGGAGFATRSKLDNSHYLNARIGWTSVRGDMQGKGLAGFLIDWIEVMAKSRGVINISAEIDDLPFEEKMCKRYERHGYQRGFNVDDYFGPNRDLRTYYCDFSKEKTTSAPLSVTEIQSGDRENLETLVHKAYSKPRFDEFSECLDLFLRQDQNKGILKPLSVHIRAQNGESEAFAILTESIIYPNVLELHWYGVKMNSTDSILHLRHALAELAHKRGRNLVILFSDGEDSSLATCGFTKVTADIPHVWGDETQQVLYTKNLNHS